MTEKSDYSYCLYFTASQSVLLKTKWRVTDYEKQSDITSAKSHKDQQKGAETMDLKNYSTGVQHIGIPTNDIDKTVEFYHKLGFETAFETVNEEANEKVVFLKMGTLVVETYENHAAIDHVALDVRDIEEIFHYINEAGLNSTQDTIHFLPFWEHGVKFFTIEGPNKEKVEFSQYLSY